MSPLEKKHCEKLEEFGVNPWLSIRRRCFCDPSKKGNINNIFNYLNSQHPIIKFTIEHEKKNTLPFSDTFMLIF